MLTAGVDIGSVATKAVIFDRIRSEMAGFAVVPTGWNPRQAFESALAQALSRAGLESSDIAAMTGTGYGRVVLKKEMRVLSEISCHAKGAYFLFPKSGGIIDIGGQDSKAVSFSGHGAVADFVMNDKCAAGTGRFIQMTANLLEMEPEEFFQAAARGNPVDINSMCAVFAESEIVGLLARSVPLPDIAAGVLLSVTKRTASLVNRLPITGAWVFSGGLAGSIPMTDLLARCLGREILTPPQPQLVGALGAALLCE
jgi:predicted CoA-substrate-specific enzyme activase